MAEIGAPQAPKNADALRSIGEASAELGLKPHILRYWEQQFPNLQPLKRAGGRRYYRPEDMALLRQIDALIHAQGYTISGARQAMQDGAMPVQVQGAFLSDRVQGASLPDNVRVRLLVARARLENLLADLA